MHLAHEEVTLGVGLVQLHPGKLLYLFQLLSLFEF
jgi:hypothetical protein